MADPVDDPQCPKRCDVATPPEPTGGGRFVCVACGTEFPWPRPVTVVIDRCLGRHDVH